MKPSPLVDDLSMLYMRVVLRISRDNREKFWKEAHATYEAARVVHQQGGSAPRYVKNMLSTDKSPFAKHVRAEIVLERLTK